MIPSGVCICLPVYFTASQVQMSAVNVLGKYFAYSHIVHKLITYTQRVPRVLEGLAASAFGMGRKIIRPSALFVAHQI